MAPKMEQFIRDDQRVLPVVDGFQERVLSYRRSDTPREGWRSEDYSAAAETKLRRWSRLLAKCSRWHGTLEGANVLDVGCGDGIECLLMGLQGVKRAIGIDLQPRLLETSDRGDRTRRLACSVLGKLGLGGDLDASLSKLPVQFTEMDATRMSFPDGSFDLLVSRSAMEHIMPIEQALVEMARVVRPGGLLYLRIDPYYWIRGCHKTGLVDIPWAHARLTLDEFRRFVTESEGGKAAGKRLLRLETLNRFTGRDWRALIETGPFDILEWKEMPSPISESMLGEYPEVEDSLLDGVDRQDLICGRIELWLRKRVTDGNQNQAGRE